MGCSGFVCRIGQRKNFVKNIGDENLRNVHLKDQKRNGSNDTKIDLMTNRN
jgi:hypothetical protein